MLSTTTYAQFLQNTQSALLELRRALDQCADLQAFAAGTTTAEWVTAGAPSVADANGMAQLYDTGTDPRNPGPGYVYGASQRIVIGGQ